MQAPGLVAQHCGTSFSSPVGACKGRCPKRCQRQRCVSHGGSVLGSSMIQFGQPSCPHGQLLEQSRTLFCLRDLDPRPGRGWIPLPRPKDEFFILSGPAAASPAKQEVLGPAPLAQVGLLGPCLEVQDQGSARESALRTHQHPNSAPSKEEPHVLMSGRGLLRVTWGEETQNSDGFGLEKGRRGITGDGFTPEPGFTSLRAPVCLCRFPPPGPPFRLPHSCR